MRSAASIPWDVLIEVPAEGRYARVVRTSTATCAVLEGFDVDQLGDVRLLVDEVFLAMVAGGARRVELHIALRTRRILLELVAHHDGERARREADAGFVHTLAGVLATDVTVELDRDPPRFAATIAAI